MLINKTWKEEKRKKRKAAELRTMQKGRKEGRKEGASVTSMAEMRE